MSTSGVSRTVHRLARASAASLGVVLLASACARTPTSPTPRAPTPTTPTVPTPTPPATAWALVWADEFDAPAGTPPDPTRWVHEIGGEGWGNRERQYYTGDTSNAAHDGTGHLVITARTGAAANAQRCWYGACGYTSARLITKGRYAATYGRFEARLRVPRGQGIWPAFWMLGDDIDRVSWPASGEIDIMEHIGREPTLVYGTVHGPGYSGGASIGGPYPLQATQPPTAGYADAFHTFAVEWEANEIRWLVDGTVFRRTTPSDLPAGGQWVFNKPFFLLLNLAVGGNWPGDPNGSTVFPQALTVDYVRVYQRAPAAGAARSLR